MDAHSDIPGYLGEPKLKSVDVRLANGYGRKALAALWIISALLAILILFLILTHGDDDPAVTDMPFTPVTVLEWDFPAELEAGGTFTMVRHRCVNSDIDLPARTSVRINPLDTEGEVRALFGTEPLEFILKPGGDACEGSEEMSEIFENIPIPDDVLNGRYSAQFDTVVEDPNSQRSQTLSWQTPGFEVVGGR